MIELIPKKIQRELPWQNAFLFAVLALLILSLAVFFILFYMENKSSAELQNLEGEIAQVGTPYEKQLERDVFKTEKQIGDFAQIFKAHQNSSRLFPLLEGSSHPQVWFSSFELSMDSRRVKLTGHTLNFRILGEQLAIFRQQEMISEISLSDLSIGEAGQTNFSLDLALKQEIFK